MNITPFERELTEFVLDECSLLKEISPALKLRIEKLQRLYRERIPGHARVRFDAGDSRTPQVQTDVEDFESPPPGESDGREPESRSTVFVASGPSDDAQGDAAPADRPQADGAGRPALAVGSLAGADGAAGRGRPAPTDPGSESLKPNVGGHHYPGCEDDDFWTSDCAYGCGCWMGGTRSGGPDGIEPFGACPRGAAQ